MGLFSGLKVMGDVIKGGIDAFKASEKLEEKIKESRKDYKQELNETDNKLYKEYKKLKDKYDAETDTDKANAMMEEVEAAEVAYLLSLTKNKDLPKAFKREVQEVVDAYAESNDASFQLAEKAMMHFAKSDEEKEMVKLMMKGAKATDELDKLVAQSRKDFKDDLTAQDNKLYKAYKELNDKHAAEKNQKKANDMVQEIEDREVAYLQSLIKNPSIPKDFKNKIREAVEAYNATNDEINESLEKMK